jgi:DNA polymerase III subunit epsilon
VTLPPVELDLFPELPAPVQPVKKRVQRVRSQPKPMQNQQVVTPATGTSQNEIETAARLLEQHSDYRVLRRLQPRLHWPEASGQKTLTLLILDTETTGLDASRDSIIELAMLRLQVDLDTGLPVGDLQVYDELEDPGRPIPPEVVAITGIRDEDVLGRRLDESRIQELLQGVDLVIAHNAGFDRPFVEQRLPQFQSLAWACSFADIDWKAQGRSSAKLENLALDQGFFYDAHRAETDCHALLAILAVPLPAETRTGLARLISASQQPSLRLSALNAPFESKDKLKARGYRWDAEKRVWVSRPAQDQLDAELQWLGSHVYLSRSANVELEVIEATRKYSARSGATRRVAVFGEAAVGQTVSPN